MNITIERKKTDCNALPKGWQREEVLRKSGLSAGKVDVYYYSPSGGKVETKSKLMRQLGETIDLSSFDYQSGRHQMLNPNLSPSPSSCQPSSSNQSMVNPFQRTSIRRSIHESMGPPSPVTSAAPSRGIRPDVSLVPPIRQTASIFKQPVTVHRNHDSKVKSDLKHGTSQEKPKQLFWEKRLEGLHACDMEGNEFGPFDLPRGLKPVGPNINNGTLLQSVTTALHLNNTLPITGQTASKSALTSNAGVFLDPGQPLMYGVTITEDDIRRQEDRVTNARKKLQDALKC